MFDRGGLYQKLKTLFAFEIPETLSLNLRVGESNEEQDELLEKVGEARRQQLDHLQRIFESLEMRNSIEEIADGKCYDRISGKNANYNLNHFLVMASRYRAFEYLFNYNTQIKF